MSPKELISQSLNKLGLSEVEQKFYWTVFRLKNPKMSEIIKQGNLKKPTVYQIIKKLVGLGLVVSDEKEYGQRITAMPPSKLAYLVGAKQREYRKLELKLKDNIRQLNKMYRSQFVPPKIRQYRDQYGYLEIAQASLECQTKKILYLGEFDDYWQVVGLDYDRQEYMPTRVVRGIKIKLIHPPHKYLAKIQPKDQQELRERKVIPKDMWTLKASMMVYDDTTVFFSLPEEHIAVAITSQYIADLNRRLFENYWKVLD